MCRTAKALLVGIGDNSYAPLPSAINDVTQMEKVLSTHESGEANFECKHLISEEDLIDNPKKEDKAPEKIDSKKKRVSTDLLHARIRALFQHEVDIALFYFSGHAKTTEVGSTLSTYHDKDFGSQEGLPVSTLLALAHNALSCKRVKEVIIILDCCHSGDMGNLPFFESHTAVLPKGLSILSSSSTEQFSYTTGDKTQGVFTKYLIKGLTGGASDLLGEVSVANLFHYVDRILGAWQQRPHYKSHVSNMLSLRTCKGILSREDIKKITEVFLPQDEDESNPNEELPLTPEHELEKDNPENKNGREFKLLQRYNRVGLVVPNSPYAHMYDVAMKEGTCSLTPWGEYYWQLVKKRRV